MNKIIKIINNLFKKYEPGNEYWVYLKNIKVDPEWRKTHIGKDKFKRKRNHWYRTGEFESKILLDRKFRLIDGYSSLRIAEIHGIDRVPVYFVN